MEAPDWGDRLRADAGLRHLRWLETILRTIVVGSPSGDCVGAVSNRTIAETVGRVLYPVDSSP